jgi:hypothetical protein
LFLKNKYMDIFQYIQYLDRSGDSSVADRVDNVLLRIAKKRCWEGYEAVSGKEPYSPGSCKKKSKKKSKKSKKADAFIFEITKRAASEKKDLFEFSEDIGAQMSFEDALNNYDSRMYKVDAKGDWDNKNWMSIPEFVDRLDVDDLAAPASIDRNHIGVELPDVGFQVINMVPKAHWE